LGALKNLGRPIVENIASERKRGPFKSFFDFQARARGLNKKSLESLIKSGAFKAFEPDVDKLLSVAQKKEIHIGTQTSLFGGDEEEKSPENGKKSEEKVIHEKEAFGFYFSEHPLERFQQEFNALGLKPISQLNTVENGEVIAIGGILNTKKVKRDKNGRNYAIVNLADLESAIDVFIFSDYFERYSPLLKVDTPLIIKGRISGEEDRKSIRADEIIPLREAWRYYKKVFLNLNNHDVDETMMKQLCDLINDNKGDCEVWIKVNNDNETKKFRSRTMKVNPDSEVLDKIKLILGDHGLKIYGKI
jgi:DNA polymerase-3 subunit alpha